MRVSHATTGDALQSRTACVGVNNVWETAAIEIPIRATPRILTERRGTQDADNILSKFPDLRNTNTAPVFDVIAELHCEIGCAGNNDAPPARDYRVVCRLLKQQGLLVVPRDYDDVNFIARIRPEYLCNDPEKPNSERIVELVPIFAVGPDEEDTDRRNLQCFEGGLTVFQKVL